MGLGRSQNPLGPDGQRLKCHECESTEHLVRDCPRRRGQQQGRTLFANTYATVDPLTVLGGEPPARDDQQPQPAVHRAWMVREGRGRGRGVGMTNGRAAPQAGGDDPPLPPPAEPPQQQGPAQDPMQAADPWNGGQPSPAERPKTGTSPSRASISLRDTASRATAGIDLLEPVPAPFLARFAAMRRSARPMQGAAHLRRVEPRAGTPRPKQGGASRTHHSHATRSLDMSQAALSQQR